ncbi:MAG: hypothetical protein ACK2U0_08740 [Candidatus Promineifilaceae bacterium]|jgi:hypothetical protein
MESIKTKQSINIFMAILPLIADILAAVALFLWLPGLAARLAEPSGLNALLLVLLYILFCLGIYFSRKLLPQPEIGRWASPDWFMEPKMRGILGVIFAFFMATTFAYQLGYFEAIFQTSAGLMGEGASSAFFVYAPGSWLGFSLLVILVMAFPVDSNVSPGTHRYEILAFLSLAFTNSLLVFCAAQTRALIQVLHLVSGPALWLIVLFAFFVSLLPARAIYQSRQPYLPGWVSFTLLLFFAIFLALSA